MILFLDDISRRTRVACIAYRDHDNKPVCEGHAFTTDVISVRDFLFDVRITGGHDLPEAVLEGLAACAKLEWNGSATHQIVLVGDARPHERDMYKIEGLLEQFASHGIVVHAAHVPMRMSSTYAAQGHPEAVEKRRLQIEEHNELTEASFREIAQLGGGDKVTLEKAGDLVPAIMHLTIDEAWWPEFDEFYEMYLDLCR